MNNKIILNTLTATKNLALNILTNYPNTRLILLSGELGSGKTTFSKFFAAELGLDQKLVKSPTFNIIQEYDLKNQHKLIHIDLYRLNNSRELQELGMSELIDNEKNYILIEHADKIEQAYWHNLYLEYLTLKLKNNTKQRSAKLKFYPAKLI